MKILTAKYVVTMDGEILVGGAVAYEDDEIVDVGREQDLRKRYPNVTPEDFSSHAIVPGLINAHTHLDMCLFRDFPGDPVRNTGLNVNFIDWLIECIEYKRNTTHMRFKESVEWGIDESINAGTTCVADMGSYEGIFSLLEQKGMRAIVLPEVMSYDSSVAKDLYESALAIIEKYMDCDSDLVHVGAAPYSPFVLSRNILRIMSQYCQSSGLPLMMHVAESFSEMEFFHNSSGDIADKLFPNIGWGESLPPEHFRTPVDHLAQIGFLNARPVLVGCTHVTPKDLDLIAQTGSKIVLTPRSTQYLLQGKAPYAAMRERHIVTALGTDGIPSVNNLSLWDEMRNFVSQHDDLPLSGEEVFSMVTSHAALTLGLEDEVGRLAIGKKADFVVVDLKNMDIGSDFLMSLIQQVKDYQIHRVVVGGRVVKNLM